ncbi:tetratricopeptide repeat protein [Pseudobdellovibrio exovorus]|uniref:Ancillary SecYEG translocon subunit/Cell division coordinator CpoB TPR domain-containing protein n=1 Tax=Pseudobdellovibrio exovorus JSS TaxID=1184267 RepID=M4VAP3_9BACT|nr:tetratricopeptide repeat protein [Pseudobdellovibrio exovorus]AGH95530.1 hypothetical protein A11Q_1314 [Pseudobdellovibrio exovorus JSS]
MSLANVVEKQWKLILGVVVVVIVAVGAVALISSNAAKKEKMAQESYFMAEKKLVDVKSRQQQGTQAVAADYSSVKADFEKIVNEYEGSIAAQMAGLHLAHILVLENNAAQALSTLEKVETGSKNLTNTLVQQQKAQLLADMGKCEEAIQSWEQVIKRKEASFLHGESKLQQALCLTKLNQLQKAEEILTGLANETVNPDFGNSSVPKEAEKYLRLIQFKKVSGT